MSVTSALPSRCLLEFLEHEPPLPAATWRFSGGPCKFAPADLVDKGKAEWVWIYSDRVWQIERQITNDLVVGQIQASPGGLSRLYVALDQQTITRGANGGLALDIMDVAGIDVLDTPSACLLTSAGEGGRLVYIRTMTMYIGKSHQFNLARISSPAKQF